jgi:hypothetical protein
VIAKERIYLATVIDWHSHYVLSWQISKSAQECNLPEKQIKISMDQHGKSFG